jgi:hypothetical protein
MAKTKLIAIKLLANVAWKGRILKKDSVEKVTEEDALILIETKQAVETSEEDSAKPEKAAKEAK